MLVERNPRDGAAGDTSSSDLERLLSEAVADCQKREQTAFDAHSGAAHAPIVLLGAGQLGRRTLRALERVGRPAVAVADNNAALWGTEVENVRVYSPAEAASRFGKVATFVVSIWRAGGTHRYEQSRRQLHELGCERITSIAPLAWKYAEAMLPHYCLDLPHRVLEEAASVRAAVGLLGDARSRLEYRAQLRFRLLADFDCLPHPDQEPQYLADGLFAYSDDEDFVDGGAYNGDTLRSYLSSRDRFASYTALEPDPPNFEALQRYVSSLPSDVASRIELLALAAYSSRQRMRIAWSGSAAAALVAADGPPDPNDVECVTLDELFAGRRMSFLKLDIEGAEPDAITGAAAVIRRDRPIIAVCVYHLQNHLWRIPLLIASLVGDYRFHLRPYNEEGWDLVCYAVPRERSLTSGE